MQGDESDQTKRSVKYGNWLKASATLAQGNKRKTMEDRICISNFQYENKTFFIFLLLDGHAGSEVADYATTNFTKIMGKETIAQKGKDVRTIIKNTFLTVNKNVRHLKSGSTASLLLAISEKEEERPDIWLANVGDSTAYGIDYDKGARKLSVDHNVKFKAEHERILKDGSLSIVDGYVATKDGHMLAVTRALGDSDFGDTVTAEPHIVHVKHEYPLFALASDGLWDVVKGKEVWERLNTPVEKRAWRESAFRLNNWRQETFSQHDNSSLILVYVKKSEKKSDKKSDKPKTETEIIVDEKNKEKKKEQKTRNRKGLTIQV